MTAALSVVDLAGGYGGSTVVKGLTLSAEAGSVTGLFGRNGVGKTTLARLVQGSLSPVTGSVHLNGEDVTGMRPFMRHRLGLGYMPQTRMVFDDLTVRENLALHSNAQSLDPYFAAFPRLGERLNQLAGSMSGGERKILSFVRLMVENTSALVLDEPSEGVQPENLALMAEFIRQRARGGAAIILIEQNLKFLVQAATRFVGMDAGTSVITLDHPDVDRMRKVLSV